MAADPAAAAAAAAAAAISAAMDWRSSPDARAAAFAYIESVRVPPPTSLFPSLSPVFSVCSGVWRRLWALHGSYAVLLCRFGYVSVVARILITRDFVTSFDMHHDCCSAL